MLILADDLSGAADCAVACRRAGMSAEVRLEPRAAAGDVEALALDLDTRSRSPEEARDRTLAACRRLGGRVLYRKIDSTLRGHVGVEVAATLEAVGQDAFAIVCPAYPSMGRTVRGGSLFVRDEPLHETETWRWSGGGASDPSEILAAAGVRPARLELDELRSEGAAARLAAIKHSGASAAVCDAETDADLEALVTAGLSIDHAVWVGSGGLALPLARALKSGVTAPNSPPRRRDGPALVVVGSASSVSQDQLGLIAREPRVRLVLASARDLLRDADKSVASAIKTALADHDVDAIAVALDPGPAGPGPLISAALGALVAPLLPCFSAAVLTGGETARAVLSAAGVPALTIHGELEPGVVLSSAGDLPVVTKAGAFGRPESLSHALEALRGLA